MISPERPFDFYDGWEMFLGLDIFFTEGAIRSFYMYIIQYEQ